MASRPLMAVFRFDSSDLAANRKGEISDRQRRVLRRLSRVSNLILLGIALICVGAAVGLMVATLNLRDTGDQNWALLFIGVAAFALPGLFFLFAAIRPRKPLAVVRVSGLARIVRVERPSSTGPRHYTATELWVGETRFDVPVEAFSVIEDGQYLTVHHLSRNRHQILSVDSGPGAG